jgi:integrase
MSNRVQDCHPLKSVEDAHKPCFLGLVSNIVLDTVGRLDAPAPLPWQYPMSKKPLTAIAVAKARTGAERREIPDAGCRGLYLVIQPSGHRSWALRYRSRGRPVKFTLGPALIGAGAESATAPALDTPLSLAAARELATRTLREVQAGHDPAVAKRRRREEQHAAEADTLQAVSEEFLRREGPRLRTLVQRRSDLGLLYKPLGQLPVPEIRRAMFSREFDRIEDQRGPVRANRVQTAVKALLNWYGGRSDYVSVLTRTPARISIAKRARSHVPSDAELRAIVLAAEQDEGPFGRYLLFTLHTATRRGESASLRRSELSPDGRTWIIPGSRYKNGRDTLIPLSTAAQKIVAAMPVLGDYVFGADGTRALSDFAGGKARLDAASGVRNWVIHDTRRVARTLLSRAGISADIAEMCLGHALTGMRGTYDRHAYEAEKRHAFEALATQIERIVRPPSSDTVVPIARAKSGRRK